MAQCKFTCGVFITVALVVFAGNVESKTCWSSWINDAKPAADGSESEIALPTHLATLCPYGVIGAQCADDKGEPFHGNKTDNVNRFNVSCSKDHGLACHPWDSSRPCPDYQIQYGCVCTPASTSTVKTTTTTTTSSSLTGRLAASVHGLTTGVQGSTVVPLTNAGQGSNPNQRQRGGSWAQCGNGSQKIQYSTYMVVMMIVIKL